MIRDCPRYDYAHRPGDAISPLSLPLGVSLIPLD